MQSYHQLHLKDTGLPEKVVQPFPFPSNYLLQPRRQFSFPEMHPYDILSKRPVKLGGRIKRPW